MKKVRSSSRVVADMSSSAKCGTNAPVSASITMVGDVVFTESAIVSCAGSPATVASGKCVIIGPPAEKPSASFHADGSVSLTPCCHFGSISFVKLTRFPVGVVASSTRCAFDGNGKPQ
jgi:hypothetical protein